jgi:hypothetical protein
LRRSILACGLLLAFAGMATAATAAVGSDNRPAATTTGTTGASTTSGRLLEPPHPPLPRRNPALAGGNSRPPAP